MAEKRRGGARPGAGRPLKSGEKRTQKPINLPPAVWALVEDERREWESESDVVERLIKGANTMRAEHMAAEARARVADGRAATIEAAVGAVVREALARVAGTYTARAENDWIAWVMQVVRAGDK